MAYPLSIIALTLATPLAAQNQGGVFAGHNAIDSAAAGSGFGQAVAVIEDVNWDDYNDVLVGAPYEDVSNNDARGAVHLHCGGGSSYTTSFYGRFSDSLFGWSIAPVGYLPGSNTEDILIGAPGEDATYVFDVFPENRLDILDGPSGSAFGWSTVNLGDINLDGVNDFAIGAPNDSPNGVQEAGSVFVYSGMTRSLMGSFHGASAGDHFGYSLAGLAMAPPTPGGSGLDPAHLLAVGAPDTALGGEATVFDALTGLQVFSATGSVSTVASRFGSSLAAVSDADGDGIEELAVAAPHYAASIASFNVGQVKIYSAVAGTELRTLTGEGSFHVFGSQLGSGDINGDGHAELTVHSYKTGYGHIEIFDGVGSELLWEIEGTLEMAAVGTAMDGGMDLNGDGLPDLVCGAPLADTAAGLNAGRVAVYGIHTVLSTSEDQFSANDGGFMTFQIDFPSSEQFRRYLILASAGLGPIKLDGVFVPLSNDRILHRMVGGNPMFPGQQGQLDIAGDARVVFYLPPHVMDDRIGTTLNFAVVSSDGAGVRASSMAVPISFVP